MTIETARNFFLWCAILNYVFLLTWVLAATLGRSVMRKYMSHFFRVSDEQFELLNLWGITLYKAGIFMFNIVPCAVLYIIK